MPVDNALYDRMAETWWDEDGFLHALTALNPARFGYMRRVLTEDLRLTPAMLQVLDIGCGGGLLAEEFARLGCTVTGVDPSEKSLAAARTHAARQGLPITYRAASGEALPFADASFDVAYCCDVLEHVSDLRRVIAQTARVLKPGGIYLYDTINRTARSRFIVITLLQQWRWTAVMPPGLHDWKMFIKPDELRRLLEGQGLVPAGLIGLKPGANLFRVVRALRRCKRGLISPVEAARQTSPGESRDTSVAYMGYARKAASTSPRS
jgi:2-polyprenyl-6-hydroxyphenyl methylase / 3-demethylubiquinone-9 3-methyltransferase